MFYSIGIIIYFFFFLFVMIMFDLFFYLFELRFISLERDILRLVYFFFVFVDCVVIRFNLLVGKGVNFLLFVDFFVNLVVVIRKIRNDFY